MVTTRGTGNLRPDIDLPGPLVEEKYVLNKHETSCLCDGREEAVENARCHEGVKRRGSSAPSRGGKRDEEEPKDDGKTAKVGTEDNHCRCQS
jgi:hypothetical protein